jgi:hypothetical protein
MSIAHELSSDVAAAMLARQDVESPQSTGDLAEVVIEVHSTLRKLTAEGRRHRAGRKESVDASRSANAGAGAE